MKLSNKMINQRCSSYLCMTQISLTLFILSGCNGGASSTNSTTQNEVLNQFRQREAIVVSAINAGKPIVIPSVLKTNRELQIESEGAYGSLIGKPAIAAVGNDTYLSGAPCIIVNNSFAQTTFTAPNRDSVTIQKVTSNDTGSQSTVIAASLSGGVGLFSASASADIKNSSLFSKSSIGFTVISGLGGQHLVSRLDTSSLSGFFKPQYLTNGILNQNYNSLCGDSFVSKEVYSAVVKGMLSIELENQQSASSFGASLSASYGTFTEVSASINNAESSSHAKGSVSLFISQLGGISGKLNESGISQGLITCSLDKFSNCEDAMNKLLEYSKTIGDQVRDPATSALIPSRLSYGSPSLTRYSDIINLSSGLPTDPKAISAIQTLNSLYLNTLKLYYGLKSNGSILQNNAQQVFKVEILDKLIAREKYLVSMAPLCYNSPSLCATTYLPDMLATINSQYKIDVEKLKFYSKIYTAENFMNINTKFGSEIESQHIYTTLLPSLIYSKNGTTTYSYVNQAISNCGSSICQAGKIMVIVEPVTGVPNVNYRIRFDRFGALRYDCDENRATGSLVCRGYSNSIKDGAKGKYQWNDVFKYSYIGGVSENELEQYAYPVWQ